MIMCTVTSTEQRFRKYSLYLQIMFTLVEGTKRLQFFSVKKFRRRKIFFRHCYVERDGDFAATFLSLVLDGDFRSEKENETSDARARVLTS